MATSRSDGNADVTVSSERDPGVDSAVDDTAIDDTAMDDTGAVDIAVVGAGPAGMAAAVAAADAGATVVLIDAEPSPGGQFWRHPAMPDEWAGASVEGTDGDSDGDGLWEGKDAAAGLLSASEIDALHHDLPTYRKLLQRMDFHRAAGRLEYLPGHEVWALSRRNLRPGGAFESQFDLAALDREAALHRKVVLNRWAALDRVAVLDRGAWRSLERRVSAHCLVLAPGAYDLQIPFPGWDLPGVMTAGGVQSLLKGHGVLAGKRIVVAGTGPFLLPVATGLARSGGRVLGVYEAASPAGWRRGVGAVLRNPGKITEGAGYAGLMLRHRVPYHLRSSVLRAEGDERLRSVTVAPLDRTGRPVRSRARRIEVDVLAVGWGFVPQLELPLAVGCASVAGAGGIPVIAVDEHQRSSVPGVYIAGEACGVGGAALAVVEGSIAGAAAARSVRGSSVAPAAGRNLLYRRRKTLRAFASSLADAYPVPTRWRDDLPGDTVVCRCEDVTAGAIRQVVRRDGAGDARTAKLLARPGMGWCQGRICGYATECLAADGSVPQHTAVHRPVAAPIPLGVVASRAEGGVGSS